MWLRFSSLILILTASSTSCIFEGDYDSLTQEEFDSGELLSVDELLADYLEKIEKIEVIAEKSKRDGVVPPDETERYFMQLIYTYDDIIEIIKDSNNAHKFIEAKGIQRVASTSLMVKHSQLRNRQLMLLSLLFEVAPVATRENIPISVADRLLDIFENEPNLGVKARALDILSELLPDNPTAQTRIIKFRGLEPFYQQLTKLDTTVIKNLVELFNKILKEHIEARFSNKQRTLASLDRMRLYERIGLIERLSTKPVCNGLLNIFQIAWNYNTIDNNLLAPIFETAILIRPYCLKHYRTIPKAKELFIAFQKYLSNLEKENPQLDGWEYNAIKYIIHDYVYHLSKGRDEF